MIRTLWILIIGLFTAQYSIAQYEIEVAISGLEDKEAYLGYHLGSNKYIQDTSALENGKVVFKGDETLSHGIYFIYTPNYFLEFVVTKEQVFKIKSNTTEPLLNKKIIGSPENEIFQEFQLKLAETQSKSQIIREQLAEAANKEDSSALYSQMRNNDIENKEFQLKLAQDNPESFVAQLVNLIKKPGESEAPEGLSETELRQFKFWAYRDHFWDGVDFQYEGILRTPLFLDRINEYVDRLTSPEPDSLIKTVDYLIGRSEGNPDVFRYVVVTLTNKFAQPKLMGHDAVFVHLAENYYLSGKATWSNEKMLEEFQEAVNDLKPNLIGQKAPSLQLLDTLLSPVSLTDIDAEYTVLFFYDPECGHCKKMAPMALDVYHQYRNDGVEAMGVCVPTDLEKWKKFVSEKSLDWINAADPYLRSNFRKEYNIISFPTIYVLDKDKKIIGKRIGAEQLGKFIDARMRMDGD